MYVMLFYVVCIILMLFHNKKKKKTYNIKHNAIFSSPLLYYHSMLFNTYKI